MRSVECSVAGFDPLRLRSRKGIRFADTLSCRERLREEGRSGAIVLVGVDVPVGVELDLAVVEVEVEDRRVREVAIGVRIIAPIHLWHQALRFTYRWKRNYILLALNLI